jgi:glycosyltransferase involved in cell wall biosynthesis
MPRDILHVLGTAQDDGTGVARIVADLANGLDRKKYRLHAWFLGGPGPLVELLRSAGASARPIEWPRGARDPLGAGRFLRSFLAQDFALVQQHAGGRSLRSLVRLSSRSRIVVHVHGCAEEARPQARIALEVRDADAVIAVSRSVARRIDGPPAPVVIHPGAPLRPARPMKSAHSGAGHVIGTACRLVPVKGVRDLIDATALLGREMPGLRLEIAGAGSLEDELRRHCHERGLAGRVSFLGWQRDLEPIYRRWDAFCLPSLEEGFGLAALEAMASGLPVVASATGGLAEIIEDGVSGFLAPPSDPRALAAYLSALLRDDGRRDRMGRAARLRVADRFSVQALVRAHELLYDSLLSTRQDLQVH